MVMDNVQYDSPHLAPATMLAADGRTTLRRYCVEAVVYATDIHVAHQRVNQAQIYLDAARILPTGCTHRCMQGKNSGGCGCEGCGYESN